MKAIIVLDSADNVGSAMEDVTKGDAAGYSTADREQTITAVDDIPFGFKVALCDIAAGEDRGSGFLPLAPSVSSSVWRDLPLRRSRPT